MKTPNRFVKHLLGSIITVTAAAIPCLITGSCNPSSAKTGGTRHDGAENGCAPLVVSEELLKVRIPDYLDSQLKDYEGFTVNFNEYNHTPNYVAWELLASETDGPYSRKGKKFRWDPEINECPEHNDYTNSGYDRGHMIPAADCKYSQQAMNDCFFMSNICPQHHSLNTGGWKLLEEACRDWAKRFHSVIIVAGPIYRNTDSHFIGDSQVRVPSAFFKVVLDANSQPPKAIGFIYPNMSSPGQISSYAMTVREVEALTKFDFFYQLPDSIEEAAETQYDFSQWR